MIDITVSVTQSFSNDDNNANISDSTAIINLIGGSVTNVGNTINLIDSSNSFNLIDSMVPPQPVWQGFRYISDTSTSVLPEVTSSASSITPVYWS